jgi:hypothetical protein
MFFFSMLTSVAAAYRIYPVAWHHIIYIYSPSIDLYRYAICRTVYISMQGICHNTTIPQYSLYRYIRWIMMRKPQKLRLMFTWRWVKFGGLWHNPQIRSYYKPLELMVTALWILLWWSVVWRVVSISEYILPPAGSWCDEWYLCWTPRLCWKIILVV